MQNLKWQERELKALIEELERSNVPEEGIAPTRSDLDAALAEMDVALQQQAAVIAQLIKLDDEHSDRFETWEDQVAERATRESKR
ncbi:hypothetical protein D9M69_698520 [compost metagenome]